jgi:hypothetical protein
LQCVSRAPSRAKKILANRAGRRNRAVTVRRNRLAVLRVQDVLDPICEASAAIMHENDVRSKTYTVDAG